MQTPQAFSRELLMRAYAQAEEDGFFGTDDASSWNVFATKVHIVPGSPDNIKLTTRADVEHGNDIARKQQMSDIRIGNGFDMHAVRQGPQAHPRRGRNPVIFGLDGHSDADVLVHAIMDALLGPRAWATSEGCFRIRILNTKISIPLTF